MPTKLIAEQHRSCQRPPEQHRSCQRPTEMQWLHRGADAAQKHCSLYPTQAPGPTSSRRCPRRCPRLSWRQLGPSQSTAVSLSALSPCRVWEDHTTPKTTHLYDCRPAIAAAATQNQPMAKPQRRACPRPRPASPSGAARRRRQRAPAATPCTSYEHGRSPRRRMDQSRARPCARARPGGRAGPCSRARVHRRAARRLRQRRRPRRRGRRGRAQVRQPRQQLSHLGRVVQVEGRLARLLADRAREHLRGRGAGRE